MGQKRLLPSAEGKRPLIEVGHAKLNRVTRMSPGPAGPAIKQRRWPGAHNRRKTGWPSV